MRIIAWIHTMDGLWARRPDPFDRYSIIPALTLPLPADTDLNTEHGTRFPDGQSAPRPRPLPRELSGCFGRLFEPKQARRGALD
jgi:hypothetical protein